MNKRELNGGDLQALFEKIASHNGLKLTKKAGTATFEDDEVRHIFTGFLLGIVCAKENVIHPEDLTMEEGQ